MVLKSMQGWVMALRSRLGPLLVFTVDTLSHLYILETHSATGSWVCLHAGWRGLTALFT